MDVIGRLLAAAVIGACAYANYRWFWRFRLFSDRYVAPEPDTWEDMWRRWVVTGFFGCVAVGFVIAAYVELLPFEQG